VSGAIMFAILVFRNLRREKKSAHLDAQSKIG